MKMLEKKEIIKNISRGFYSYDEQLIVQQNKVLLKINLSDFSTVKKLNLDNDLDFQNVEKEANNLIFLSGGKYVLLDINFSKLKQVNLEYAGYDIYEKRYLVSILDYSMETFENETGLYDILESKNLWKAKFGDILLIIGRRVFSKNFNRIRQYSLQEGKVLWEFCFENKFKKQTHLPIFLAAYKNVLVLGLQDDILIGINIEDGSLLWKIEECNNSNYILDKSDGKLKGVTSIGYFEVDILKGEYQRPLYMGFDKVNDPDIFDSQRDNFVLVGDHIVTTDWRKGQIGAFNTKTLVFDWVHEEKGISFPGGQPMKYVDPYLFVMDNNNTLHIFKKEQDANA